MNHSHSILIFRENEKIYFEVLEEQLYTIGRASSDKIFLASKGISRTHASIYFSENSFWLVDGSLKGKASTNGLLVNDLKVSVHQLRKHDVITFCKGVQAIFMQFNDELLLSQGLKVFLENMFDFLNISQSRLAHSEQNSGPDRKKDRGASRAAQLQTQVDDLTGLPNRKAFLARVEKSLGVNNFLLEENQFAIFFIDVDRFKMINDSLGHLAGDQFLIQLAERFKACIRPYDMAARLSGDEFAILLDNLGSVDQAITVAKRLQTNISKPLKLGDQEVFPSVSVGIASSELQYETVEEILRDADTAMYHAKRAGRSRFIVFDENMHQKAKELLQLDGDLRRAVEHQQFELYYQPIISLGLRSLLGFEALIRWNHPERGLIEPNTFIPIAEETNLIYEVGMWTVQEACRQLSVWKQNPAVQIPISVNVNLSARQLSDTNLVKRIQSVIEEYGIANDELKLEITESIAMENSQQTSKVFKQLREIGVPLVIDDFGTGYSSLSYLNRFPIDTLKIDRSFVSKINVNAENTSVSITHSIIGLAHSLGVKVVAEGIETKEQMDYLRLARCDYGQGYLFAKPFPADIATDWAERGLDWRWTST
ncbi:MAG: EAL domain-containing protein [Leptolyngbya sp. SIOISBB]|nr:EAL domain-containing protein [Leptolyngbya sp. SIOISBB]